MADRTATWNTRLAKAETLLVLALVTETLLTPWLYSHPQIPPAAQTLLKMLIIVGCFGPVFNLFSGSIDRSLQVTRTAAASAFPVPRLAAHLAIVSVLFLVFYWSMHQSLPWQGLHWPGTRQVATRR